MSLRSNVQRIAGVLGILAVAGAASGQTILIDFGNNMSYRGASVVNPDANGHYWNSVHSGAFYADLLDSNGATTDVDFGFSFTSGEDSYNGPAGTSTNPANSVYNAAALGDLGADAAVFDYYVTSNFQIQGLDPAKTYNVTFFGSHKYNLDENTTRYTAYTDSNFNTPIASVELLVGVDELHNQGNVVTLENLSPDATGIIYIGFEGTNGLNFYNGYLNCLKIVPALDLSFSSQPAGAVVDAGGMLTFTAGVSTSDPSPTFQWEKDGSPLSDDAHISGSDTASLTISPAGSDDVGEYRLSVETSSGSMATSDPAVGAVRASPDRHDVNSDGSVDFFDLADLLNAL